MFPREIEEVVAEDDEVAAVAVVGTPDPELGQVPVAYLVVRGVHDASDLDVARAALDRIRRAPRRRGWCAASGRSRSTWCRACRPAPRARCVDATWGPTTGPVLYRLDCR